MLSMPVEQLRATVGTGDVAGVILNRSECSFFVEIATHSGQDAMQ